MDKNTFIFSATLFRRSIHVMLRRQYVDHTKILPTSLLFLGLYSYYCVLFVLDRFQHQHDLIKEHGRG